jgi:hypothetical protein
MGIMGLIGMLFGADVAAPPDAIRLDATTETTLTRSLFRRQLHAVRGAGLFRKRQQ